SGWPLDPPSARSTGSSAISWASPRALALVRLGQWCSRGRVGRATVPLGPYSWAGDRAWPPGTPLTDSYGSCGRNPSGGVYVFFCRRGGDPGDVGSLAGLESPDGGGESNWGRRDP